MITLEECVAFCGLTEEEVLAIAEHERIPEIAATALADHLTHQEYGAEKIRDMIVDDIRSSQALNDKTMSSPFFTFSIIFCGHTRRRDQNSIPGVVVSRKSDSIVELSSAHEFPFA